MAHTTYPVYFQRATLNAEERTSVEPALLHSAMGSTSGIGWTRHATGPASLSARLRERCPHEQPSNGARASLGRASGIIFNDTRFRRISVTHGPHDRDSSAAPAIPTPTVGAGSADLRTTSDDPEELRRLLQLAQERLAFYETFDRIVGENLRRSGELMLERINLREQAAEAARARDEREALLAQTKQAYRKLLRELLRDGATLRSGLDGMQARLQAAEQILAPSVEDAAVPAGPALQPDQDRQAAEDERPEQDQEFPATTANDAATLPDQSADTAAMEAGGAVLPASGPKPDHQPERESDSEAWETPQVIELIAHGVPRAADALSLQRYLGGLDHVAGVEAREFAEGVLRLQITAQSPIEPDEIRGWPDHPQTRVLQHQPNVIEIDCGSAFP